MFQMYGFDYKFKKMTLWVNYGYILRNLFGMVAICSRSIILTIM